MNWKDYMRNMFLFQLIKHVIRLSLFARLAIKSASKMNLVLILLLLALLRLKLLTQKMKFFKTIGLF
jgi:hypothetical protein